MWLVVVRERIDGNGLMAFTFKMSEGEDVLAQLRKCFGMSAIKNVWSFSTKKKAVLTAETFNKRQTK